LGALEKEEMLNWLFTKKRNAAIKPAHGHDDEDFRDSGKKIMYSQQRILTLSVASNTSK